MPEAHCSCTCSFFQECEEVLKDLNSEEIALDVDISERLDVNLEHEVTGCGEDGDIITEEKKTSFIKGIMSLIILAIVNEFKLPSQLCNGTKVTENCRTFVEHNEDGEISNSGLNTEDSDGKLIDDSNGQMKKKTMESNNVQIDDFNLSDDHSHSHIYIDDLPVNDSGFTNICNSVNEIPYNYEESELSNFSSKTEGHCEMQLKADYNVLKENPATTKDCSKAPVECFGTSSHCCNELNMTLAIQSSREKPDASTNSCNVPVDDDNKFNYSHTVGAGGVKEKSHKENNEIQNGEDNKGGSRFNDRGNVTDLQDKCLSTVSSVDDAPLQGGNNENDESNCSLEKQGIDHKTPTVDDPKLGKVSTLTTDFIRCQDQNYSPLTDVSNVVYGDFKILADSVNPNTSDECSNELVSKCENRCNNSTEVSGQVLQNESGIHQAQNNTCVPCCSLKMRKAYSKISHDSNSSALTTNCIKSLDQDCTSEIDNSDRNHFTSKGSSNIVYETGEKLRDPDPCLTNFDLSNDFGDCDITHNSSEGASNRCKNSEDTKFRKFNYDNVTSRDQRYVLISIIDKFLDGLKCESEVHNSICGKSKETPDMPSYYLKRGNERRERNTVEIKGRTKLSCIYITADGAKNHGKMLTLQR